MPPQESEQARWFAREVQPHGPMLRAWLVQRFPSLSDVDDLVQESFLRLVHAWERGEIRSPRALLFATARNLAIDSVRRQQVIAFEPMVEIDDPSVFEDDADVAETVSHRQELDLLTEAIQTLPERCRQVCTLRMTHGLSQKEIAARLGISESTVEKQLAKAIQRCAEFLARHGLP